MSIHDLLHTGKPPPEQKPVPSAAARNPCPAARDTALLSTHAFINSIYTVKRSQDCGPQSFHRPRHNTIREEVVVEGEAAGCQRGRGHRAVKGFGG